MKPGLKSYFDRWKREVDQALDRFLPKAAAEPRGLHKAMRYSVFAGGKRLRPVLVIGAAETCGLAGNKVLPTACAMELIHTYSLIHDDLPAMDDDDLRRGRPTSHKVFGEAVAILTGDALLTYAFQLLAENVKITPSADAASAIRAVALGAGDLGMVGGQAVDIEMGEGKWIRRPRKAQVRTLKTIHQKKTAALIRASILAGAVWARADARALRALSAYGENIGLAFQIADDVLDVVGDKKLLGKSGSDAANRKLTYAALFGVEESKRRAQALVRSAKRSLGMFGKKAEFLSDLADYIVDRTY